MLERMFLPACGAAALVLTAGHLLGATGPSSAGAVPDWQWPLRPRPPVVGVFAAPADRYAAGHRGVDLAATVGQPVRAAGAGVVGFAGSVAGRGVVSVTHPDGRRTTYEPVVPSVSRGERVRAGDVLGRVSAAAGHCLPATCLHWGLRVDDHTYRDPLGLLGAPAVRLLPLWRADPRGWAVHEPARARTAPPDRGPLMAGLGPR
jgi:murein DD-endopeptidase MepM/ murein hydrolase activator NlpD